METVSLELEGKTCKIHVGSKMLAGAGALISENNPSSRFAIITNPTVNSLFGKEVSGSLAEAGLEHSIIEVPDSESSKSLEVANGIYSRLSDAGFDRDSCVIGLGGGVVGDLAGFVAATYMRGIRLVQIPTTLLAQADSAIGGKSGVNMPQGKNLVGAFHQPSMVISDVATLITLPDRDYRSGLAEVLKYGMILDEGFFGDLERDSDIILRRDGESLERVVARCSRLKASIVEQDERERGKRLLLNFGHTLGHALEAASGYGYRHGEAVALGMLFAASVSVDSGTLAQRDLDRLAELISRFCLPTRIGREVDPGEVLAFMGSDKKRSGGRLRLVLPTRVGCGIVSDGVGREAIASALGRMFE